MGCVLAGHQGSVIKFLHRSRHRVDLGVEREPLVAHRAAGGAVGGAAGGAVDGTAGGGPIGIGIGGAVDSFADPVEPLATLVQNKGREARGSEAEDRERRAICKHRPGEPIAIDQVAEATDAFTAPAGLCSVSQVDEAAGEAGHVH